MPRRLYQHVYWHSASEKWVVVKRGLDAPGLVSTDQESVARGLAKLLGTVARKLLLKGKKVAPKARKQARQYHYIYWHATRKVWRVSSDAVADSTQSRPAFADQHSAATWLAKYFNVSRKDLRLPKQKQRKHCVPSQSKDANIFKVCWSLYRSRGKASKCPGDYENLLSYPQLKREFKHAPWCIVPFVLAKVADHRDCLLSIVREQQSSGMSPRRALQEWFERQDGQSVSRAWRECVMRHNAHHSGLVQYLSKRLGLVAPCGPQTPRAK